MKKNKTFLEPVYPLDAEEQELLDSVNRGEWKPVPNAKQEIAKLQRSATLTLKLLKSKNINLRLQPTTITQLKSKAAKLGMPYQTLIASILHRYSTGQVIYPEG
jgi:predicted DNA binding CopG/RHH family protein